MLTDKERIKILEDGINRIGSIGEVWAYPDHWNSFKQGGSPSIEDYESINLDELARSVINESNA